MGRTPGETVGLLRVRGRFGCTQDGSASVDICRTALWGAVRAFGMDTLSTGGGRCFCIESILTRVAERRGAIYPILINSIPLCVGPSASRTESALKVNSCGGLSGRRPPPGVSLRLKPPQEFTNWSSIG